VSLRDDVRNRRPPAVAIVIAIVSIAALAALAWGVFVDTGVAQWDRAALAWIRSHAPASSVGILTVVSALHRPRMIVAATAIALAVLLWRRERTGALLLTAALAGGATLNHLIKHALQWPRPDDAGRWVAVTDFGFPSGHVANATLLYGTLALLMAWRLRSRLGRAAAGVVAAAVVVTVAASRLVLGAHYPSDVAAGAALAVGWLALCVIVLHRWRS